MEDPNVLVAAINTLTRRVSELEVLYERSKKEIARLDGIVASNRSKTIDAMTIIHGRINECQGGVDQNEEILRKLKLVFEEED